MAIPCVKWDDFDEYWDVYDVWESVDITWNTMPQNWDWNGVATDYIWDACVEIAKAVVAAGVRGPSGRIKIPDDEVVDSIITLVCRVRGYDEVIQKRMKRDVRIIINNMIENEHKLNESIKVRVHAI